MSLRSSFDLIHVNLHFAQQSSITLVGELLFKVSGISGKVAEADEEEVQPEITMVESSRKALVDALGVERRDRVLAALYIVRQDGVAVVRQSSVQIWKVLVNNTPRTGIPKVFHPDYPKLMIL